MRVPSAGTWQDGAAVPPDSHLRPIHRVKEQGQLFGNPMDES